MDKVKEGEKSPKFAENEQLYQTYVLWKSLPSIFKKFGRQGAEERFGIDDEELLTLVDIKTQTAFSEKYGVHINTLTDWNKLILKRDEFADIRVWMQRLTKNVLSSVYNSAMKSDPKASADRKLFLQFKGWIEKSAIDHKVEGLGDLMRVKLRERRLKERDDRSTTN